jgi:hypothetical protein
MVGTTELEAQDELYSLTWMGAPAATMLKS